MPADAQKILTAESQHTSYLRRHNMPQLVEALLMRTVSTSHPFPHEAVQQSLIVNAPAEDTIAKQVRLVVAFMDPVGPSVSNQTQPQQQHDELRRILTTLAFNVFDFDPCGPELIACMWWMFESCGVVETFHIPRDVFLRWAIVVRSNYHHDNPFHNFRHAFNVLQTLYAFLHQAEGLKRPHADGMAVDGFVFSQVEVFAMLVAAVCHDLQHPGVNNAFLSDTLHPLAIRYNDHAVLEQHHASVAFAVLEFRPLPCGVRAPPASLGVSSAPLLLSNNREESFCDICANMPRRWGLVGTPATLVVRSLQSDAITGKNSSSIGDDFMSFRKLVSQLILGTEVAAHKRHVEELTNRVVEPVCGASDACLSEFQKFFTISADRDARVALMVALVEAADLSNEIRTFDFSRRWAPLVVEEFCRQGDAMKALQWVVDIPPMLRRGVAHPTKDQPGFIQFLCLPLYRQLARVFPFFETCVLALECNAQQWKSTW